MCNTTTRGTLRVEINGELLVFRLNNHTDMRENLASAKTLEDIEAFTVELREICEARHRMNFTPNAYNVLLG